MDFCYHNLWIPVGAGMTCQTNIFQKSVTILWDICLMLKTIDDCKTKFNGILSGAVNEEYAVCCLEAGRIIGGLYSKEKAWYML
jgi:hypothetical protein